MGARVADLEESADMLREIGEAEGADGDGGGVDEEHEGGPEAVVEECAAGELGGAGVGEGDGDRVCEGGAGAYGDGEINKLGDAAAHEGGDEGVGEDGEAADDAFESGVREAAA